MNKYAHWIVCTALAFVAGLLGPRAHGQVLEAPGRLPLIDEVDVVIAGGTTGSVAAAMEARRSGASVMLVTPYTYLGSDLVTSRELALGAQASVDPIYQRLLADPKALEAEGAAGRWIRPMHVKKVLEELLIDAEIRFLFGCFPTELLVDDAGRAAGIVFASRSGRQAIGAKLVIDATPSGHLTPGPRKRLAGPVGFTRVVAVAQGYDPPEPEDAQVEALAFKLPYVKGRRKTGQAGLFRISKAIETSGDLTWAKINRINHDLIQASWSRGQVDSSEFAGFGFPWQVVCKSHVKGPWPGASQVNLDAFRPAQRAGILLLGPVAGVDDRDGMCKPNVLLGLGRRIGRAAAREAQGAKRQGEPKLLPALESDQALDAGRIRELHRGPRGLDWQGATVASPGGQLPLLAEVDVVVVGGGTGGGPAGIAAARKGAKVLVLEFLHGLGGVSTLGQIPRYYHGYREGFTKEMDAGVRSLTGVSQIEAKMEWYRRSILDAGGQVWFRALGCGAVVRGDRLTGVVVATPMGRGVVLAKRVIDATGNSDIAAAAGADCREPGQGHLAVQGAGLPPIQPGQGYRNTDYAFAVDHDVVDMWRFFIQSRRTFPGAYDSGALIDTRERRRIVGQVTVSPLDIYLQKRYSDTICLARSNFDTHGYTVHPLFLLEPPDRAAIMADVPLRALLPRDLLGILVTGLGISAHRDAMPLLRMQPDVQNQGYAAGYIAAVSADRKRPITSLDLREIQAHLVKKEIVPNRVLTDVDTAGPDRKEIIEAVARLPKDPQALAWILARPEISVPAMRTAFVEAGDQDRLRYAQVLGMCGDPTGAGTLAEAIAEASWDKGWRYRGMGQFGRSISHLDSLILALGRTREQAHVGVLVEKARGLKKDPELSHCRALASAFVSLGQGQGAQALARLLEKQGISGHAVTHPEKIPTGARDDRTRSRELRELLLARACYALGDSEGQARRILEAYAKDLRGLYVRGARDALARPAGWALRNNDGG
jgi:hypothetical protein